VHIFISFSKHDIAFARYLRNLLEDRDFTVWMDDQNRMSDTAQWPTFEQQIATCAAFIIIMSPEALDSKWIEREIQTAQSLTSPKTIIPVLLMGEPWESLGNLPYEDMRAGLAVKLSPTLLENLTLAIRSAVA